MLTYRHFNIANNQSITGRHHNDDTFAFGKSDEYIYPRKYTGTPDDHLFTIDDICKSWNSSTVPCHAISTHLLVDNAWFSIDCNTLIRNASFICEKEIEIYQQVPKLKLQFRIPLECSTNYIFLEQTICLHLSDNKSHAPIKDAIMFDLNINYFKDDIYSNNHMIVKYNPQTFRCSCYVSSDIYTVPVKHWAEHDCQCPSATKMIVISKLIGIISLPVKFYFTCSNGNYISNVYVDDGRRRRK